MAEQVFIVKGFVRKATGEAVPRVYVRAFDIDLRSQEELGITKTGELGEYSIQYAPSKFFRAEKSWADLRLNAEDPATGSILARSSIYFNAPNPASVDITIGGDSVRALSEFDALLALIQPVLNGVDPSDLVENADRQDFSFLTGETGADRASLEDLARAFFLEKNLQADLISGLRILLYALFRQNFPREITSLLQQDAQTLTDAVERAVRNNVVTLPSEKIDAAISFLKEKSIGISAGTTQSSEGTVKVGNVLKRFLPNTAPILQAFANAKATDDFWNDIRTRPETRDSAKSIQLGFQLGTLTLNHTPLIEQLQSLNVGSVNDLSKYRQSHWLDMIKKPGVGAPSEIPGQTEDEKNITYAKVISNLVEDMNPTQFTMNRLGDPDDTTEFKTSSQRADVISFLKQNQKFDLKGLRAADFIKQRDNQLVFNNLVVSDRDALLSNLEKMQRLSAVAPRYQQISVLMNRGVTSALQISRMGSAVFSREFGEALGGAREAQQIYDRAEFTHGMAFNMFVSFGAHASRISIAAIANHAKDLATQPPPGVPDWASLFGSVDVGICDECRSMSSPAAYLVDMLHFLRDRKYNGMDAKTVLFERRPDIGEIELTCENTKTPLPYIDLVNEILENAVNPASPFVKFDLAANAANALIRGELNDLRGSFNPPLSTFATLTTIVEGTRWKIDEPSFTYNLQLKGSGVAVTSRSLQTSGSAAERAALPQYQNAAAYDILSKQVYGQYLPFEMPLETVRTFLRHLGLERSRLMQAFQPPTFHQGQLSFDAAIEYLNMSQSEYMLIRGSTAPQATNVNTPDTWKLWGFPSPTLNNANTIRNPTNKQVPIFQGEWKQVLAQRVDVFIQQAGIGYTDFLNLLQVTSTLRSGWTPEIKVIDGAPPDTCQLDQLYIVGLGQDQDLRMLVVFLRLWKKLQNWSMLDLARSFHVLALGSLTIDEAFLSNIAHVQLLCSQLNLEVETVLSFFGSLDTKPYVEYTSDGEAIRQEPNFDKVFNSSLIVRQADLRLQGPAFLAAGSIENYESSITAGLNITSNDLKLLMGAGGVLSATDISVVNLSFLFRHVTLARTLEITIQTYLPLLKLIDEDPFHTPAGTSQFVARSQALLNSGFDLATLNYILRHDDSVSSSISLGDAKISAMLAELRSRLQKISRDHALVMESVDEKGELIGKKFASLSLDPSTVAKVVGTLRETVTFTTKLSAPLSSDEPIFTVSDPLQYPIPGDLRSKFTYNAELDELQFLGTMTKEEQTMLLKPDARLKPQIVEAIKALFKAPRAFLINILYGISTPRRTTRLETIPEGVLIPDNLRERVFHDPINQLLCVEGVLTELQVESLRLGAPDPIKHKPFIEALDKVVTSSGASSDLANSFLSSGDIDTLLDTRDVNSGLSVAQSRFVFVLQKLLPYLQNILSDQVVAQYLIEELSMESSMTDFVLTNVKLDNFPSLRSILRDKSYSESISKIAPTRSLFNIQFKSIDLIQKISLLVSGFKLSVRQLEWIWPSNGPGGASIADSNTKWLHFNEIPLKFTDKAHALFLDWERLNALVMLRDSISGGERTLDMIFAAARQPSSPDQLDKILQPLFDLHTYSSDDLRYLAGPQGFGLRIPDSFQNEIGLAAMIRCIEMCQLIGCSVRDAQRLTKPQLSADEERLMVRATKSKYDQSTWEATVPPLRNLLREKQRDALVEHLLTRPRTAGQPYWHDSNDLFSFFLIDVEMSPCQEYVGRHELHPTR